MSGNSVDFIGIERAGFKAAPALEERESDGIVLRFSNGHTKRANSVNLLQEQTSDIGALVKQCESFYRSKSLPCIFRIPSFSSNEKLDRYLESQGYKYIDRSLVLLKSLKGVSFDYVELVTKSPRDWLQSYCAINEINFDDQLTHLEMMGRIKDEALFAVMRVAGEEVACGVGVISNGLFGLFSIATKKSVRKQGYATQLINGLLHWAVNKGAVNAYLQVVAENQPAVKLYEKWGFQPCYEYGYRIQS